MNAKLSDAFSYYQNGQLNKSEKLCIEIKKKEPKNFQNLNLLGIILFQKKDFNQSIKLMKNSIEINPNQAETNNNLGLMLIQLKRYDDAIKYFKNTIKINPNFFEAYNNLGIAYKEINKDGEAINQWKKAITINPKNINAYNNIGNVLMETRKEINAIEYYQQAIKINNKYYTAYFNLGNAYQKLNLLKQSIINYDNAIKLKTDYAEAYYNRANSYRDLNLLDKALNDYKSAYKINPNLENLRGNIIITKNYICDWNGFNEDLLFIKNEVEKNKNVIDPFSSLSIINSPSIQKKIAFMHSSYSKKKINVIKDKNKNNSKIKLGYYSSDFNNHPVAHLIAGMFEEHDRSKFELYAFSLNSSKNDEMTKRLSSAFDHFFDVSSKTNEEIVEQSRKHNIDIAIDLMGFTKFNRFEIFLQKCAPIQINYLGYSGTFGSDCMDYIVADKNLIENEADFSEKIIYLPDTFMVTDYKKLKLNNKFKRIDYGLPQDAFVFCCFNKQYKFNPEIFNIWMNLLKKINNSILWLKVSNELAKKNILNEAQKRNVSPNKIIFAEKTNLEDHLSRYQLADLFLDTSPYGAHTTCADSLWSGLPVLTKTGSTFSSKVSSSLLSTVGLYDLIAQNNNDYENIAINFASNSEKLLAVKKKLEHNKIKKNLFKTKIFTKNLEKAYKIVHERYLKKLPPENLNI